MSTTWSSTGARFGSEERRPPNGSGTATAITANGARDTTIKHNRPSRSCCIERGKEVAVSEAVGTGHQGPSMAFGNPSHPADGGYSHPCSVYVFDHTDSQRLSNSAYELWRGKRSRS